MSNKNQSGKKGRPTVYKKSLANRICDRIAEGESLRSICRDSDMPHVQTVRRWLADDNKKDFRAQYIRAREEQADYYADVIVEEADKAKDRDSAAAAKVKVDARKWVASKLKPKKYGEKLDIDQTSEVTHKFEDMTDEQLDRAIKERQDRVS